MAQYLEFEKPIAELEGKIEELRHLSGSSSLNIADEVAKLAGTIAYDVMTSVSRRVPRSYG